MAGSTKVLTFKFVGDGRGAAKTMNSLGKAAGRVGAAAAAGFAIAGAAAVAFGVESVKAFVEADKAQNQLSDAYARFPALADASIASLRSLNTEIMKKTGFDDDALAAAQANLASFKLTGQQITRLTPLLADYARRTGRDLPESATLLGKALLGNGRALKEIGINFKNTGSLGGNFEELMSGLQSKVGGFADAFGQTNAGKLEIFTQRLEEFKEKIGGIILPAVMPELEKFFDWLDTDAGKQFVRDFQGAVQSVVLFWGAWAYGVAQIAPLVSSWQGGFVDWYEGIPAGIKPAVMALVQFNAAAMGNPGAWEKFTGLVGSAFTKAKDLLTVTARHFANGMITMFNGLFGPLNQVLSVLNQISGTNFKPIKLGLLVGSPTITSPSAPTIPRQAGAFASGGIVPPVAGGWSATVGEGGHPEAIVPLTRQNLAAMGGGGSGMTVNIHVTGVVATDRNGLAKVVTQAIRDAQKLGIPGTAFG